MIRYSGKTLIAIFLAGTLIVAFTGETLSKRDCNCTKWPFAPDPPCYKVCTGKVLAMSPLSKLVRIVGLGERLAQKVVDFRGRHNITTPDDLKDEFTTSEIAEISRQLRGLNQEKVDELQLDRR